MAQGKLLKFKTDTHKYKTWVKRKDKNQGRLEAERVDKERMLQDIQSFKF